jgi:hypothetical protein
MIEKYLQTTNVYFFHVDFFILKFDKYLKPLTTDTYKITIHPK